jgi:hypothetical protein
VNNNCEHDLRLGVIQVNNHEANPNKPLVMTTRLVSRAEEVAARHAI